MALLLVGAGAVVLAATSSVYILFAGYASGCGHGMRIVGAAGAGFVASVLTSRLRLPAWAVWTAVGVMTFFVLAGTSLSNDYLSGGGCRYADPAATEDAVSAGLCAFCGGLAVSFALRRERL